MEPSHPEQLPPGQHRGSIWPKLNWRLGVKGSYVLVLHLSQDRRLEVGKLGRFEFPSGYYLYFGSALNGLAGRIRRHLRREKKLHWHIDFLTAVAPVVQVWWVAREERCECHWSRAALGHRGARATARGFGASDCRCPTHLVQLPGWAEVEALRDRLNPGSSPINVLYPQREDSTSAMLR